MDDNSAEVSSATTEPQRSTAERNRFIDIDRMIDIVGSNFNFLTLTLKPVTGGGSVMREASEQYPISGTIKCEGNMRP
eukprot:6186565-Pleurochrysis_carterae.AAC.4